MKRTLIVAPLALASIALSSSPGLAQLAQVPADPLPAVTATSGPVDKADTLREEAHLLYRAKKYAAACPRYQDAASLAPQRGELWTDLGICLFHLGKRDEAKRATLEAISRGSKHVRRVAYRNLFRLGERLKPPGTGCGEWPCSRPGCSKPLHVCRYTESCLSGTGRSIESSGLSFCPTEEHARDYQPNCQDGEECFGIQLSYFEEDFCRPLVGGAPCGVCSCAEAPDPKTCEEAVARCLREAITTGSQNCVFVYADAERGHVGAICNGVAVEISPHSDLEIPKRALRSSPSDESSVNPR